MQLDKLRPEDLPRETEALAELLHACVHAGASVGFVRLEEIQSEFSVPAASVVLSDVNFYDSSVVLGLGIGGGVQIDLSERLAVQGGIEFKWHGDANDVDGLAGTGLESINDESRRWSMPITGGVTVRF